jgi:sirohydrochlorin ferrochelatase
VPSFLVETYLARDSVPAALTQGSSRVRFDRSIHIPEDEICFYVFDARSAREVARAAKRAGLDPIRIVEAISYGKD